MEEISRAKTSSSVASIRTRLSEACGVEALVWGLGLVGVLTAGLGALVGHLSARQFTYGTVLGSSRGQGHRPFAVLVVEPPFRVVQDLLDADRRFAGQAVYHGE